MNPLARSVLTSAALLASACGGAPGADLVGTWRATAVVSGTADGSTPDCIDRTDITDLTFAADMTASSIQTSTYEASNARCTTPPARASCVHTSRIAGQRWSAMVDGAMSSVTISPGPDGATNTLETTGCGAASLNYPPRASPGETSPQTEAYRVEGSTLHYRGVDYTRAP